MTSLPTACSPTNREDLLQGTATRGNEDGPWLLEWFPGFDIPIGLEGRAYLRRLLNHRRAEDPAACVSVGCCSRSSPHVSLPSSLGHRCHTQ